MFWADKITEDIQEKLAAKIDAGKTLLVRDEKTASGRVHVGSMRGVAIHGLVTDVLKEKRIGAAFSYEINDFDPMDGLPVYLDAGKYEQYMGKPLMQVPSPEDGASNFAEYFAQEFIEVIRETGFDPTFYRASELYLSGRMNDVIRTALDRAADIRRIYKEVSGAQRRDDWFPLSVVCEHCGRIGTTRVHTWDGDQVSYVCEVAMVEWAKGCGNEGSVSPFDGRAKLPWKVEWPAKWKVLGVDIEGAGKDHSTKGGSRDVANHISRDVFEYEPPYDIPYEFFLVGGAKMSASKGEGASARDMADLLPTKILRLSLLQKQPMQAINVEPDGETVPTLFDAYDAIAEKYWSDVEDDDARLFSLLHGGNPPAQHYLPRFSTVAFLVQMPHVDIEEEFAKLKGEGLGREDAGELRERAEYARSWLEKYAPEKYRSEIQQSLPEAAHALSPEQKKALGEILAFLEQNEDVSGEDFHHALHDIRKRLDIAPKDFFSAVYLIILGKDHGPKAGWFLGVLERDFLLQRLREATV